MGVVTTSAKTRRLEEDQELVVDRISGLPGVEEAALE
jgi:hypothetical protein